MEIVARVNNLVGKRGLLPVRCGAHSCEIPFEFLAVAAAKRLPMEADDEPGFQSLVTRSRFTVRFENEIRLDGSNAGVISGHYISRIMGAA
jgi:hypothetical protein